MNAQPEPIDCGMKYDPVGPGSWTKSRPTSSVTSSNQIGPSTSSGARSGVVGPVREQPSNPRVKPELTANDVQSNRQAEVDMAFPGDAARQSSFFA